MLKQIINHIKPDIIHLFRERDLTVLFNNSGNATKVFTDFKASHPTLLRRIIWKKADVITVFSKKLQAAYQNKFKNIFYIDPWLDLQQIPKNPQNMRLKFGLSEDDFIVGLIMRVQSYRRFELVVEIAKLIKQSGKKIKFLLLGRGHLIQKLAAEPVKRNGLTDVIIFGGYRNQDYWNAIHCFNIMFYTVAGSDGTARALRQCQAMGKPVICLRSDFTQEIVHEGIDGFLVQDKPIEVLEKILKFYIDSNMLSDFSKRSEYQGEQYDIMKIGQEMYKLYENQMMGK